MLYGEVLWTLVDEGALVGSEGCYIDFRGEINLDISGLDKEVEGVIIDIFWREKAHGGKIKNVWPTPLLFSFLFSLFLLLTALSLSLFALGH